MSPTVRIKGRVYHDGGDIDLDAADVRLADGTRLTEAQARELAEEVLEKARSGRPSLTQPGVHSPQLRFSVPAELKRRLQDRAEAEHRTPSAVAREALERFLAS